MHSTGRRRATLLLSILTGGWLVPAAAAMPPPTPAPHKRATIEVGPVDQRVTKPSTPAQAAGAPGGRPAVTLDDFLRDRNERWKKLATRQIEKMRALVRITPDDDPQKPDFLFRLGELYADDQRFYGHQARALDQPIFEAPAAAKAGLRTKQQQLEQQEQKWLLESATAFIAATRYPRYPRMDEVLFRLSYLLTSAKKEGEARVFLLRLIKDHPTSRYIPDAYLVFAELYFERGDMDAALRFYEKVEQFPAASVYPYAVYKKGWCAINRGEYKAALEIFVAVARMAEDPRVKVPPDQLAVLTKEARKDVVTAYAHVGGPAKAWEFFRRVGGESAGKMMEALAERYWEQGQAADSSRVYRKIIAENPQSERLCEWQNKVLRNELSAGTKPTQLQELDRLAAVHDLRAPRNADGAGEKPKGRALECRDAFHDAARELALVWHREAQRTRNADTYRLADRAYRLFLSHFPDDKDAYEMAFYAGEVLWSLEQWQDAAEQYTRVVDMNPRGRFLRDAAYAAVLSWKNATASADVDPREKVEAERADMERRRHDGRLAPRPIPAPLRKMIEAFHNYRKHVPDAPELPVITYREAYIYYDHNQFEQAAPLFRQVVEKYASHELGIFAANLFLDCLNAAGRTDELMPWVRKFLETPALVRDRTFADQMISLMSDAYAREGHQHEKHGNAKECGRSFLAAAEARADHPQHAERLWNAGQCFQNAHLVGKAVGAWQMLIDAHPDDRLAKRALYRVGAGYQQLAYYGKSADFYERFAKRFPGEPEAVQALANATTFRRGLGESAQALADMDAFIGNYGRTNPARAAGVALQKAEVYDGDGKRDDLRAHLREFLSTWGERAGVAAGVDRQMLAHFRLGELARQGSCAHPSATGACVQIERVASTRGRQMLSDAQRKYGKGERSRRTQCGPTTKSRIVVLDRNRGQAGEAEQHLQAVLKSWRAGQGATTIVGADAEARRASAAYVAAGAAFYQAEQAYEDLLRIKFPAHLDFSRPSASASPKRQAAVRQRLEDSTKRFEAYLREKAAALEQARTRYLDVFKLRQAHWTIAAAARIGQLHQDFAGQLYTAPIPDDLVEVDQWGNHPRELYCDALEDKAGKIEAQAIEAFRTCLTAATNESWYNEWSQLCEAELNQLEPTQFPIAAEIRPESRFVPTTFIPTPVLMSLSDQ